PRRPRRLPPAARARLHGCLRRDLLRRHPRRRRPRGLGRGRVSRPHHTGAPRNPRANRARIGYEAAMTAATGAALIADLGRELGFARAAVVPIEPPRRHALYRSWLARGHAGTMAYLAAPDHIAQRGDLRALLATARSLIVVALAYDRADPIPPDALLR